MKRLRNHHKKQFKSSKTYLCQLLLLWLKRPPYFSWIWPVLQQKILFRNKNSLQTRCSRLKNSKRACNKLRQLCIKHRHCSSTKWRQNSKKNLTCWTMGIMRMTWRLTSIRPVETYKISHLQLIGPNKVNTPRNLIINLRKMMNWSQKRNLRMTLAQNTNRKKNWKAISKVANNKKKLLFHQLFRIYPSNNKKYKISRNLNHLPK